MPQHSLLVSLIFLILDTPHTVKTLVINRLCNPNRVHLLFLVGSHTIQVIATLKYHSQGCLRKNVQYTVWRSQELASKLKLCALIMSPHGEEKKAFLCP